MTAESKQNESVCNVSNGSQDGAIMCGSKALAQRAFVCARVLCRGRENICKRHVYRRLYRHRHDCVCIVRNINRSLS